MGGGGRGHQAVALVALLPAGRQVEQPLAVSQQHRVDLLEVHVVPVLLGGGERLLDLPAGWQERYERDRLVASPAAAHFRYLRKG